MDFAEEHEVAAFRNSGQFDEQWYVEEYPDVKIVGMDPAQHYLWIGARLGRRPSPAAEGAAAAFRPDSEGRSNQSGQHDRAPKRINGVRAAMQKINHAIDSRNTLRILTPELRARIAESALFDGDYYKTEYGSRILNNDDLLADYIGTFQTDLTRDPGHLFSTAHYINTHPDVQDIHPFIHYIEYGMEEGRAAFCPEKVNSFFSSASEIKLEKLSDIVPNDRPVNVLYWEDGNFFFTDVACFLEQLLNEQGYSATARTQLPEGNSDDALNLVVAPHEFCAIGPGQYWTAEQYADAIYVNTEQWQTSWFALSLKYLKRTKRGVLDLNPSSAQGLVKMGLRAAFLPLLPMPGSCFDFSEVAALSEHVTRLKFVEELGWPGEFHDRPYDVVCCAILNSRRAKVLARLAPVLSRHRCFIHVPKFDRPIKPGEPDVLAVTDFARIACNSRIMLNIHQGESHYLEWQRVFLVGMMQGAVVVSEPCHPNKYVQPDVHYIEASLEDMGAAITELLSTEHGKRKMSQIHANVMKLRKAILAGERLLT